MLRSPFNRSIGTLRTIDTQSVHSVPSHIARRCRRGTAKTALPRYANSVVLYVPYDHSIDSQHFRLTIHSVRAAFLLRMLPTVEPLPIACQASLSRWEVCESQSSTFPPPVRLLPMIGPPAGRRTRGAVQDRSRRWQSAASRPRARVSPGSLLSIRSSVHGAWLIGPKTDRPMAYSLDGTTAILSTTVP